MTAVRKSTSDEMVDTLVDIIHQKLPCELQNLAQAFVSQYFSGVSPEDLDESDAVNLYGAAMAHFNYARYRVPGTPKVHVYNPQFEQHGWQSTHTIIEIVTDDMPFLVDSVRMAVNRLGLTTHLLIHPVVRLRRDDSGCLLSVLPPEEEVEDQITEAIMHCEVDRQTEPERLAAIKRDVEQALADVRVAVEDWQPIRVNLRELLSDLESYPPGLDEDELAEGKAFLEWIDNHHFTFLGCRDYELTKGSDEDVLRSIANSGLGLLRNPNGSAVSESFAALPLAQRREAQRSTLLIITKGNVRSTVHRPSFMDYIGVKRFNHKGEVVGERRFLGLYTSAAYNRNPRSIPLLRQKVRNIVDRAGFAPNSHAEKTLLNVLDTYPRDELFQTTEEQMYEVALGILHLQERQRIRLFVHKDLFGRFVSCIVFVPRERFNTDIRLKIQGILEASFNGQSADFTVRLTESVLARLYFVIWLPQATLPEYDVSQIESRLRDVTRTWSDDLHAALLEHCGEARGSRLWRRYGEAFRAEYREHYSARVAVHDIEKMETLEGRGTLAMSLYQQLEAPDDELQFKLFQYNKPVSLSEALPMLENMGLTVRAEHPSTIVPAADEPIWMHDFAMVHNEGNQLELDSIRDIFQDAFAKIWDREVEDDGFNRLVLRAGLSWREIVILRACCKYLRQAGVAFSQDYMEDALAGNPHIARSLVNLFQARFDPDSQGEPQTREAPIIEEIHCALDAVVNLDEDRILRSFLTFIQALLRTNFYQHGDAGPYKSYLSLKLDPARVPELPEPRPMFEIFVYSPRVEGVHLRGGPVARGGVRWSDRREDFRTEVLSLVKAQIVKNAVIVPVGSKGGFVPKLLPVGDHKAILAEGVACYRLFIKGLLDLTDNLVDGAVQSPRAVIRYDDDDPYLVVAADKGTATFSDYANEIAFDYGYWLGDAFASGGSDGHDHKAMGVTAAGAWESVKRHFRELGINVQTTDFTAIGIGDMSGDVFGNGMLLSKHIRLVGAFNHLHVFLDPNPDAARSYKERKRLFELPLSTWENYDRTLISKGGGVFPRNAKSIPLTKEIQDALGITSDSLAPNELIGAMLRAPVDLLWNGGIGTYAKASSEGHSAVGDRTNDSLRVDAIQMRCRVVGEGGNLGLTQLGRIEYAMAGGRINTDAIDNSGGVDCSDHEVNIKIMLNAAVAGGDMTEKQRNKLLKEMTDEVGEQVLRNNYVQSQALSCAIAQAPSLLEDHERLIDALEREGRLNRGIEFLPDKEQLSERRAGGAGLCAPELSVLMAYMKIKLFQELLGSDLPEDPFFARELRDYFPTALHCHFLNQIEEHRLSREIISTVVANDLVNRTGVTFAFRLSEETGATAAEISRAYTVARDVYKMESLWMEIEALDNQVAAQDQTYMLLESRRLVERAARWFLRHRPKPLEVANNIEHFAPGVDALDQRLLSLLANSSLRQLKSSGNKLTRAGVPDSLAQRISKFSALYSALDIVEVATSVGLSIDEVGAVYFKLGETLHLPWLRDQVTKLPRDNRWQSLARDALRDDLYEQEAALTAHVLRGDAKVFNAKSRIDAWMRANRRSITRCQQVINDLKAGGNADFAMMSVAMREIRALRQIEAV